MVQQQIIQHPYWLILIKLFAAHILADFVFQPDSWVKSRNNYRAKSFYLYLHGFIAGLTAYIFLGLWPNFFVFAFIVISHVAIDLWKSYHKQNIVFFLADQFLHVVASIMAWLLIVGYNINLMNGLRQILSDFNVWLVLTAYLIVIWPMGYTIAYSTRKWRKSIDDKGKLSSLKEAGKWIGIIERIIILTFVLYKMYEGIGFLIAAKSVYRFGDIKDKNDKKEAEYYLIGTLLSFSMAILLGIATRLMLNI
jgi:hypothetical protein